MASSLFTNSVTATRGCRDEVYVAAVPLTAAKGPSQLLMSAVYSLNLWDLQHFMVIIKPSSPPPNFQAIVFDFQPKDPENIYTAIEVLSGRAVSGEPIKFSNMDLVEINVQESERHNELVLLDIACVGTVIVRNLTKLPRKKCWFVGSSKLDNTVDLAMKFNENWETDLRVGHHDCRDYTNGLVEQLTGKKHVLEDLQSSGRAS